MRRYLLLVWFALVAVCSTGMAQRGGPTSAIFVEIDPIMKELSTISGFQVKQKVPYDTLNRQQLQAYLEERVKQTNKPEQVRAEELTLKKFGFVPADFNLERATIELITEQAAAFYDDERRKMYMIQGAASMMEKMALVHELAHALADQHYPLGKFVRREGKSDDAQLARMAVVEGQAMWLMLEYTMAQVGQSLRKNPGFLSMMSQATDMTAGQYPVFDKAPLYLRETLLFPYTAGVKFQQELLTRNGSAAFQQVFEQPPASSQQVMHIEQYLAHAKPTSPALPAFSTSGYKSLGDGPIGEFDHFVLLKQYAKEIDPSALAAHWKGGQFQLWEAKTGGRTVLRYASEWDSAEQAKTYFQQYQKALQGKWKRYKLTDEQSDRLVGEGDDGYFVLQVKGGVVTSLEGLASPPEAGAAAGR